MANWDELLNSVSAGTKPLFVEFVNSLTAEVAGDIPEYAEEVSEYLAQWLHSNVTADDEVIKRNLAHVRVQLQNLAVKHAIIVHHKTMLMIEKVTDVVLRALIVALKITLA